MNEGDGVAFMWGVLVGLAVGLLTGSLVGHIASTARRPRMHTDRATQCAMYYRGAKTQADSFQVYLKCGVVK